MGCLHLLAFALNVLAHQRRKHALAQHDRAYLVGHALRDAGRVLGLGVGCGHHQAASCLSAAVKRGQVRIGTLGSVTVGRAVHQHWIDLAELLVAHAQTLGHALAEVLNEYIRVFHQLVNDLPAAFGLEVYGHAALAPVGRLEVCVAAAAQVHCQAGGPPQASARVTVQRFYFDDIGAHIRHH